LFFISILSTMQLQLIAHRGYTAHYPENTLTGIEAAIRAGAEFVEVDIQLAADGTPVLFHDRTLDRMCGVAGSIADYSPQQLTQFSASEPERFGHAFHGTPVATLSELTELMRRHSPVHFFIELKRISIKHHGANYMLEQTARALEGLQHQCTLISFDTGILEMAKLQGWRTGRVVEHWVSIGQLSETDFLFCDVEGLPPSGDLHLPGTALAVYEVADPEQARALAARGVDFVETFAIGEMRAALAGC